MPSSEYYFDEEMAFEFGGRQPSEVICKFCGKSGLHWHEGQRWALVNARGAIHDCRRQPADIDEFDVIED